MSAYHYNGIKPMKQSKKTAWEVEDKLRWQIANSQAVGKGIYY